MNRAASLAIAFLTAAWVSAEGEPATLPGTSLLSAQGDLSGQMVAGIDRFLTAQTRESVKSRAALWKRDFSSPEAYSKSVAANRERFRKMIGAVEKTLSGTEMELVGSSAAPALRLETPLFTVTSVRWRVLPGVFGEGLWLKPKRAASAGIVAIPDADQTPEMLIGLAPGLAAERQWARRLAEAGCEVIVITLVDRQDAFSGSSVAKRFTNQPHREWIYRQGFELGRHIIGYECLKVSGAIDFLEQQAKSNGSPAGKIGVAGYGEGGLIAFYTAAVDERAAAALVSGYFDSRQQVWAEPIYRNVFGLLTEFGDAEIASLVLPRGLVLEYSEAPQVEGPPKPREGRSGAAPGRITTADSNSVETEFERIRSVLKPGKKSDYLNVDLITGVEGATTGPGSDRALEALLNRLAVQVPQLPAPGELPGPLLPQMDPAARQERQVKELETYTQALLRKAEAERQESFWSKATGVSAQEWAAKSVSLRKSLSEDVLGTFGRPTAPLNARTRQFVDKPNWTGYEVMLDVYPDVFAWGCLLVPKQIPPGERRPIVVCQHGLEGVPADVINDDPNSPGFRYYKAFGSRLADQGFVVFAPHNPYRGADKFRVLQRKANPLGRSLFSIIIAQHTRALEFLQALPFVDPKRIGFYGLSYGGKTAMRVPAVLEGYSLSVCSGDFNEWIYKNVSVEFPGSYMYTGEYEMPEWNLGHTFNYGEMAALIAPRPFMVERGHSDGVGRDEWVAYEYAKVRRFYDELGLADRTAIEFFNGPHTINGVGTFDFLHRHLKWP